MLSRGNRSSPAAERTPGNGVLAANTRPGPVCHRQLQRSHGRLLRYFLRYRSALSQSSHGGQPVQWILRHWAQGGDRPGGRAVLGGGLGEVSAACEVGDLGDPRGPQAGRAPGSGRRSRVQSNPARFVGGMRHDVRVADEVRSSARGPEKPQGDVPVAAQPFTHLGVPHAEHYRRLTTSPRWCCASACPATATPL